MRADALHRFFPPRPALKWAIVVLAALAAVSPRLFFLHVPYERDEGGYAYVSDVMDRGGIPYRDAFDQKPPGVYYLYNVSFRLFGHALESPRITALIFTGAACLMVFLFVSRISGDFFGGLLGMAFLGLSSSAAAYTGYGSNSEIFTLPFLLGGCLPLLDDDAPPRAYLVSGLLFGLAFVIKQVAAPIAFAAFLCSASRLFRKPTRLAASSGLFILGSAAPLLGLMLRFAMLGAFRAFWDGFYTFNAGYAGTIPLRTACRIFLNSMKTILSMDPITWLAASAGLASFLLRRQERFFKRLILSLLLGSFLGVAASRRFFPHYFVIMLPFLSIAAALGAARLNRVWPRALWLLILAADVALQARYAAAPAKELLAGLYGEAPFYQSLALGKYLRSRAEPGATAFIAGSEGQILFYSGLKCPTRIFYFYPLQILSTLRDGFRREVLSSLKAQPPDFFLQVNDFGSHAIDPRMQDPFIAELFSLFSSYQLEAASFGGSSEVSLDHASLARALRENPGGSILVFRKPRLDQLAPAKHALTPASLNPAAENYLNLSLAYYGKGRYQESISAARRALKLRPDYAEAYNNIGAAYCAMKLWDKALAPLKKALRLNPRFQLARNNLNWAMSMKTASAKDH